MATNIPDPAEFIQPLNMNGMRGRMLRMPPKKSGQREMLLLYGSHASIERMWGFAQAMHKYGGVTLPDWPGFGGMDSLFSIGRKPDMDTMADYLAAFVRMRYKRRRYTIVAMSYGFAVATKMLQKYPELAKQVDLVVSMVGFVRADDFHVPKRNFLLMKYGSWLCRGRVVSWFANLVIRPATIRLVYNTISKGHSKMKDAADEERRERIEFEVVLWRINDLRTYFYTAATMFRLNLCNAQVEGVPLYHIAVADDQFFDNAVVEQHLNVIYTPVTVVPVRLPAHMPTVLATAQEVMPFFPRRLQTLLKAAP